MVNLSLSTNNIGNHKYNMTPFWWGKLVNYEYWPIWFFYIPTGIYVLYLMFKARSISYFTNVNPSIKDSGLIRYSKFGVLASIPESYKPLGRLINGNEKNVFLPPGFTYPVLVKPDMGERGKGVSIIHSNKDLKLYAANTNQNFIIQEYCDLPLEAAIFYIRKPSETRGKITSFTTKEFLSVLGNGYQNIGQLMSLSFRARLQMSRMSQEYLETVPKNGEVVKIESIGNHNRGTRFINSNHLISEKLVTVFDDISKQIDGFYFGRYDLKFKSLADLEQGVNFKIVELNGINSEPVHIYDQSTGLFNAYADVFAHMKAIFEIGEENMRLGFKRTNGPAFWKSIFLGK